MAAEAVKVVVRCRPMNQRENKLKSEVSIKCGMTQDRIMQASHSQIKLL